MSGRNTGTIGHSGLAYTPVHIRVLNRSVLLAKMIASLDKEEERGTSRRSEIVRDKRCNNRG